MGTSWLRTLGWWITTMVLSKCWRRTATSMRRRTMETMVITATWWADLEGCSANGDQLTCSCPPLHHWLAMAMPMATLITMATTAPMAMTKGTMAIVEMMAMAMAKGFLVEMERGNRVCLSQVFTLCGFRFVSVFALFLFCVDIAFFVCSPGHFPKLNNFRAGKCDEIPGYGDGSAGGKMKKLKNLGMDVPLWCY